MSDFDKKVSNQRSRAIRTRAGISGTPERPRMSVKISNQHVSVQIIDDTVGKTLATATTVGGKVTGSLTEKATNVGSEIAKNAKKSKITKVVLDRGPKKYHGRIKALADEARKGGLEF